MDGRRKRFLAALALYAVWVALLAALVAYEGRTPPPRPDPAVQVGR